MVPWAIKGTLLKPENLNWKVSIFICCIKEDNSKAWALSGVFVGGANFLRGQMLVFQPNFSIMTRNVSILTK